MALVGLGAIDFLSKRCKIKKKIDYGLMHAERNICCDFLFASEKETTAGLDAVEPKVLLRTVDPGSIPEFRG